MSHNDQWMPVLTVKPDGNQLFIGWLDRRNDTNNSLIDVYGRWGTIATDGGVTLTNEFRISTQSFRIVGADSGKSARTHVRGYGAGRPTDTLNASGKL